MKKNIILVLKGMIVGLANVIPGVSGGTLMITLGIYEKVIDVISHFFKNFKENLKFILPLGIGLVLAILLFSKIIGLSLDKYPFATTLFFIGLILGGLPLLWKKVNTKKKKISNWLVFALTFALVTTFAFLKSGNNVQVLENLGLGGYLLLFSVGIIASSTMIIPGISGSFVLMLLGYYKPIIDTVRSLTNFSLLGHNIIILGIFGLGVLIGIILVAKLIEFLLKKYEVKTYYGVLGFVLASMIAIIKPLLGIDLNFLEVIVAFILFIIGFLAAYKMSEK